MKTISLFSNQKIRNFSLTLERKKSASEDSIKHDVNAYVSLLASVLLVIGCAYVAISFCLLSPNANEKFSTAIAHLQQ